MTPAAKDDPRYEWITRLVSELSDFLDEPVEVVDQLLMEAGEYPYHGFCCFIRSAPPNGRAFQLCWEGHLCAHLLNEAFRTHATLYLYSRDRRLLARDETDLSVFQVTYEGSPDSGGLWVDPQWVQDVYGEYDGYDSYGPDAP